MVTRSLVLAVVLALAIPAIVSARSSRVQPDNSATSSFTYQLSVTSACTLQLQTTGTITFPSVSASGASGENSPGNVATVACEANTANLNVYDGLNNGTFTFVMTDAHADEVDFRVCSQLNDAGCFRNTSNPSEGETVTNLTGSPAPYSIYGWLLGSQITPPGSYSDVVTVALSWT